MKSKFRLQNCAFSYLYIFPNKVKGTCPFFQVDWGEASMLQAERILLENALEDLHNERFVFVSDRLAFVLAVVLCVPALFIRL